MAEEVASVEEEGIVAPESSEIEQQPEPETGQEPEQAEPDGVEPEKPEDEPEKPKKLKGVGKRLHQLTSRIHQLESALAQASKSAEPSKPPEPVKGLKDFDFDEGKYSQYLFDRAKAEAVEAAKAETSTWRQQEEARSRRESFESRLADFADDHPDLFDGWDETPISQPMADAIEVSEVGPEVAYYLKNNQDVALKLYQLSPVVAAKEIGRIEQRIVMEKEKAKQKPVSQAPSPPPKIEGGDPGNIERNPSKMTDSQFKKWREKTIARRSGYR